MLTPPRPVPPKPLRVKKEPVWSAFLTLVPREVYKSAVRALENAEARYRAAQITATALTQIKDQQAELIDGLEAERTQIRASLMSLPVYEDLVGPAPLTVMVAQVARDHEELEARIESVLDVILTRVNLDGLPKDSEEFDTLNRIAGLLQGQIPRVPDTPEELDTP